jgi:hypothetical protein
MSSTGLSEVHQPECRNPTVAHERRSVWLFERSASRRAVVGDLLSSGRDAPRPEPGCGLGAASDRHPRSQRKGCGDPARAVRSARPTRSDPEAASSLGTVRLRVRLPGRGVPGQLQDGVGIALTRRPKGHETKRAKPGVRVDRLKLRQIDLHWHDITKAPADCWRAASTSGSSS